MTWGQSTSKMKRETISSARCLHPTSRSQRLHNTSQWRSMGSTAACSAGSVLIGGKLLRGFCGPARDQREEKATNVTFVYQLVSTSLTAPAHLQLVSYPRCFELVCDAAPQDCSSLWLHHLIPQIETQIPPRKNINLPSCASGGRCT